MTARNLKALADSQVTREEIRRLLLTHHPLAPPLTAKEIVPKLARQIAPSTVHWHLRAIWTAHSLETEQPNSAATSANLPSEKRADNGSEPEIA